MILFCVVHSSNLVNVHTIMTLQVLIFVSCLSFVISTPWSRDNGCPSTCTCREEHFLDLSISRYIRNPNNNFETPIPDYNTMNDVLQEDEIEFNDENELLRTATCLIQAETNIDDFLLTIPKNIQALSFIQSANSGNKTLRTGYLNYFNELIILEVYGSNSITSEFSSDDFVIEIDDAILSLKYLNLQQTRIKNGKYKDMQVQIKEQIENIEIKFESLTMIQKKEKEILPYYKYREIQQNLENAYFSEFSNIIFIRLHSCNLLNIYPEMFDNLQNLKYLLLDNNNLKFLPKFAFYGTPNLIILSLARNNLLNIQITDLAGLLELEFLDLSYNNFSQLSELSFPPFPKLKVADFRNNPITTVFPNTFAIMNTTDSIILGSDEIKFEILSNSFLGLSKLVKLTIYNANVEILTKDMLNGMPILKELILTGFINKIEFDAFTKVKKLEKLILKNCNIYNISMDAFYELENLIVLDLSSNRLKYLPPNVFDQQINLKELYLNDNELTELPTGIFNFIPAKLIRLNNNPWHCSCAMSEWNSMVVNIIKNKKITPCNSLYDKGLSCGHVSKFEYLYENRVAPKCNTPKKINNFSVFQALKKYYKCKNKNLKLKNSEKLIKENAEVNNLDLQPTKSMYSKINQHKYIKLKENTESNRLSNNYIYENPQERKYNLLSNKTNVPYSYFDVNMEKKLYKLYKKKKYNKFIKT